MKKALIKISFYLFCLAPLLGMAADHPFNYDLHLTRIPGENSRTMVCLHGMGGNFQIAYYLKNFLNENLVSFNFPDHDLNLQRADLNKLSYGSIQEILPVIFVLKKLIVEEGKNEIHLYGFSAGGGAIINTIATLKRSNHDSDLQAIGVSRADKKKILDTLQKGLIILDVPLKSVAEILTVRGPDKMLEVLSQKYRSNQMEPINALQHLEGLALNIVLYFNFPDEVLSNRHDSMFIKRLKEYNKSGITKVIVGQAASHNAYHPELWDFYKR